MAGLYIHIPFCASRCIYCGFYSTTRLDLRQQYVDALIRELVEVGRSKMLKDDSISTVYLGGGTPSQLTIPQLHQLFDAIYIYNKVESGAEVTIEMNPDDVSVPYADTLRQLGINRVSMGAQTFDDERLRWLNRRHTVAQVGQAVKILRAAGIRNISIDLMYGFPDETIDDFVRDIDEAIKLDVEHISAYCLMIEEGTELYRRYGDKRVREYDDSKEETERKMYELLIDKLTAAGYEHYEISNFARPSFRSRHNSSYWTGVPYIGLGAAAHSFDGHLRSWNVSDIRQYIAAVNRDERLNEEEVLSATDFYNERVMLGLRTCEGVDLSALSDDERNYCIQEAQPFLSDDILLLTDNRLVLTRKGLFVSDYVISSLMQA
jgi:oxygen-independent coproporphyrinogen-3 oxidase